MTKRFILVDSALDGPGGHYSTYARNILDAAREGGFATFLATRRKGVGPFAGEHPTLPSLTCDFVENFVDAAGLGAPLLAEVLSVASKRRDRWLASWPGRFGSSRLIRRLFITAALTPALRTVLERRLTGRPLRKAAGVFTADLEAILLSLGEPGAGDVVFMPTVFAAEALGVARVVEKGIGAGIAWRLLFRRDPEVEPYTSERVMTLRRRRLGLALQKLKEKGDVQLFTDTDELTALHRRLFQVPFTTATIPVVPLHKGASRDGPLRIAYLGDARAEKGFHLLPDVIAQTAPRDGFHFVIQDNPETATGELACRVARSRLLDKNNLSLLEGPLSDRAYEAALAASDVIILPYDRVIYRARSSGIFVEAMAAGIPVIVTSGSWMAGQLQPLEQSWLRSLSAGQPERPSTHLHIVIATAPLGVGRLTLVGRSADGRAVGRWTRNYADALHYITPSNCEGVPLHYELLDETGATLAAKLKFTPVGDNAAPSAVGLIVDPNAASIAAGLMQLHRQYPHFFRTAQENRPAWIAKHRSESLLDDILSQPSSF